MYWLYSALLAMGLLLTLPYWLLQMSRHGKYRAGLSERLGRTPKRLSAQPMRSTVWVHAVSVGEVLAISGLVAELRRELPQHRVVVSTTTDTGQKLARKQFGAENVFYFPMDFTVSIRPYLRLLRPELVVIAETEFWPNFLRLSHVSGARIAVVNARISDRSWPRYRRLRRLLTKVLEDVDLFLAQTEEDARRLRDIGALAQRVQVMGNLKFDVPAPPRPPIVASLHAAFQQAEAAPILVCGSTAEGEEPLLLRAFENVLASHPRALMILAPRQPERFAEVARLLEELGVRFWRRSLWSGDPLFGGVLLIDTIGELSALYALADIAFVGGSLVPRGGHNIIEPARHGVPIVIGNHTENFRDIVSLFQRHQAVWVVTPAELPLIFMELISNQAERAALGRRAAETLRSQTGATLGTAEALTALLQRTKDCSTMTSSGRASQGRACYAMNPLAAIFGAGVGVRNALYDRGTLPQRRLLGPVISIGNLSVGGAGKTPFALLLGQLLQARGISFDILSRGYGRQTSGTLVVDPAGSPRDFGDEPLLLARRLGVPVVVGEDRVQAGQLAERQFGPQLHLLDDGFQHRRLARCFDIVLVTPDDARDQLIPAGRLREPISSLSRADAVVLANGASPEAFPVVGKLIWRVRRGILPRGVPNHPVVFCGIARPNNFLLQLRTAGIEPVAEAFYRDHHAYTERDIQDLLRLRQQSGAEGFVTTEKDAINLGSHLSALQPLAVVAVKMELVDAANALDTMLRLIEERKRQP